MAGMKLAVALAAAMAVATLVGCASGQTKGQEQIEDLTADINAYAKSLRQTRTELETTLSEHDQIINNKDGDLLKHYKAFSNGLNRTESAAADAKKAREKARGAAGAFFRNWQADIDKITDQDLKKLSAERMQQTQERFNLISTEAGKTREVYEKLMAILKNHATFFASDLNATSAAALRKDSGEVSKLSEELFARADRIQKAAADYNASVAMRQPPPEKQ